MIIIIIFCVATQLSTGKNPGKTTHTHTIILLFPTSSRILCVFPPFSSLNKTNCEQFFLLFLHPPCNTKVCHTKKKATPKKKVLTQHYLHNLIFNFFFYSRRRCCWINIVSRTCRGNFNGLVCTRLFPSRRAAQWIVLFFRVLGFLSMSSSTKKWKQKTLILRFCGAVDAIV